MNRTPLVSVGLPTYNRASELRRAIESVLSQEYSNLELVISDNASTDHTQRVCEEFCIQDNRVKYIRQSSNRGPLANFVEVLGQARGEFFMWLGDDDWLDSSYVSQCAQKLIENPDYSLVCGGAKYYQDEQFLRDGETIILLQDSAAKRMLIYYGEVVHNGSFYGLMRPRQLHSALPPNVLGSDWLLVAAIAFMGKIDTIRSTTVHRSWAGSSRNLKTLIAGLGISNIHAYAPHLSIALAACRDVWRSSAYDSLRRRARLWLACRVWVAFSRRYFLPFWRAALHPYWARPVHFAISMRDKVRKRFVS